jgi:hypothetical protein
MESLDTLRLDRVIADLASAGLGRFAASPSDETSGAFDRPIPRQVASRDRVLELAERGADPLAHVLRPWVERLTIERVTRDDALRVVRAVRIERHATALEGGDVTIAELVRSLVEPRGDGERRVRALAAIAGRASGEIERFAERRREAARLLGIDIATRERAGVDLEALARAVERVADATRVPFLERHERGSLVQLVDRATARDAGEGWPVHLGPRWLQSSFERVPLLAGLRLPALRFPPVNGAASFARGLAAFGAAVAHVDRPQNMPFSVARAPFDTLPDERATLFAGLVLEPSFHRRRLGLGRDRARAQVRVLARAALAWLRFALVAWRAWELASTPRGEREAEELAERWLEVDVPRGLGRVLPSARPDAARGLVGALLGALARERLREGFDEDWFEHPRAIEALRHEHHRAAAERVVDTNRLDAGAAALTRWLVEALEG